MNCLSNLKFKKSPNNNNDNGIFAPEIVLATLIIVSGNWMWLKFKILAIM